MYPFGLRKHNVISEINELFYSNACIVIIGYHLKMARLFVLSLPWKVILLIPKSQISSAFPNEIKFLCVNPKTYYLQVCVTIGLITNISSVGLTYLRSHF